MACKNRFYALFEWHSIEKSFKFYHSPCLHAALQFFMSMSPERLVTCTEMFSSSVACRPGVLQRLECIMSSYTKLLSSQPSKTVKFCSLKLVKSRAFLKSDVFELTSRLLKPRNLSFFILCCKTHWILSQSFKAAYKIFPKSPSNHWRLIEWQFFCFLSGRFSWRSSRCEREKM